MVYKTTMASRCLASRNVAPPITDHPTRAQIDLQTFRCIKQHSRMRLATSAFVFVCVRATLNAV
jgi:hypothetical protein